MFLHLTQLLDASAGGLATAVLALNGALNHTGVQSQVIGFSRTPQINDSVNALRAGTLNRFFFHPYLAREVQQSLAVSLHVHGLWVYPNYVAGREARRSGRSLVIHPHGMLEPWALQRSACRKKVMRWLFENRNFESAALWRALSSREADQIRAVAPHARIAVIPNGVNLLTDAAPPRTFLEDRFPELRDKRWLLFLSRVNRKKGVALLLDSWRQIASAFPDWHLVLGGPMEDAEPAVRECERDPDMAARFTATGMLEGEAKACALRNANLFVLPSYSEGFSMAALEAMAARVPVLITTGCNFPEVADVSAGLISEAAEAPFTSSLREMLALPGNVLGSMGQSGLALVQRKYTWRQVALDLREAVEGIGE